MLYIPMTSAVLIWSWGNRTKKIRKQSFIPFRLGSDVFEKVRIIAPDMPADHILRVDFLNEFKVEISFKDRSMCTTSGHNIRRHRFLNEVMDGEEKSNGRC